MYITNLATRTTSLHFYGLYQNGTTEMDGPAGVTQCAIPTGSSFTYNFTVNQPGTYRYQSHANGQYPDGLRGAFIVDDPDSPYEGKYDEDIVLTVSDWYHDQIHDPLKDFISYKNSTGAEPVPDSVLWNDTSDLQIHVQPGNTYYIRMINIGAFAGQYVWFKGHTFRIVEVDGIYTEEAETDMIYLTAAQRCSGLLTTKNDTSSNYPFVARTDEDLFDTIPDTLNPHATA